MKPRTTVSLAALLMFSVCLSATGLAEAHEIIVRDAGALHSALRNLKPGTTLKIGPGEYPGGHTVAGVEKLTLEALDPKQPPVFKGGKTGFQFSRCTDLTLRHLRISGQSVNGLNLDDGGDLAHPVTGITLEHVEVSDIGPTGNHDGIKCSGLDRATIRDCTITGWGGQGIDFVGCHRSLITGCRLIGKEGFSASAGIQLKGGTSDIIVENCHFINAGERPLNLGGSTGLPYFRPQGAKHEAARLIVRNNTIEGGLCAAAFVGVDGVEFVGNTVRYPGKWIFRILQETQLPGFAPCRNVLIKENRITFRRSQVQTDINIGPGTAPETFRFENNHWLAEDQPQASQPRLPVEEKTGSVRPRPLLLANYYCWYHDGQHPKRPFLHWTYPSSETNALAKKAQRPGEPPLNSVFRPLAGLYDSADPQVAEWHVQLALAAGIDAFLVDWWDTHNQLDQNVDRGIVAAAQKHGFKFALLDERAQFHQKLEEYQQMLARALKRYKDNPVYLRIEGRPVVYLYQVAAEPGLTAAEFPLLKKYVEGQVGPVYWIVDKIAHDGAAVKAGDLDREKCIPAEWLATPGVDCFGFYSTFSNFRAHTYEQLAGKYRYMTKLAHDAGKKMLLPVHPGHDNSYFRDDPYVMPRRDGQTLRDFLHAATDAGADYIMVTSWNEWPESTVVEPSSSWPDPYLYLKIFAEWKGLPFTQPPLPTMKE